jgi:hypothetical protein
VAEDVGHALGVGEGDRVVAAEDAGIAPARATFSTAASSAGSAVSMSPENISTSPASTIRRSRMPSVRRARLGREPPCGM